MAFKIVLWLQYTTMKERRNQRLLPHLFPGRRKDKLYVEVSITGAENKNYVCLLPALALPPPAPRTDLPVPYSAHQMYRFGENLKKRDGEFT